MVEKAPEAPPPQPKGTCADATGGLIKMNKTMPPEVALGSEFTTELHLVAQACAANVVVRDTVPANAAYVRSEPSATADGKNCPGRSATSKPAIPATSSSAQGRAGRHDRELCLRVV